MRYLKRIFILAFILTSCEEIIEVEDISNDAVILIAPVNEVVINTSSPTFSWQAVTDAEQYNIQIASPSFNEASQIVLDSLVSTTSFTQNLSEGNYEWRVKALNSAYETVFTTQGFSINPEEAEDISNETVNLLAPANNVTLTEGTVNFSWDNVPNADSYIIQIAQPDFDNTVEIIENESTTSTNFAVNMTANDYEWRIKATNAISETDYTTQSFTVEE